MKSTYLCRKTKLDCWTERTDELNRCKHDGMFDTFRKDEQYKDAKLVRQSNGGHEEEKGINMGRIEKNSERI